MDTPAVETSKDPALKLNFLSHGTLESKNLDAARKFYTEFLGLEVVRTSPISLLIRLEVLTQSPLSSRKIATKKCQC